MKHLPDCPVQVKVSFRASILKDQKITVARIWQAKSVLWTYNFQYKNKILFFFWGKVNAIRASIFIKFVLYLPEWANSDKNLCSTLPPDHLHVSLILVYACIHHPSLLSPTHSKKWQQEFSTVAPRYNEVLGTMKITLLYQVSHYIRVKKQKYKELGPPILPCYKRVLLYPTSL